MDQLVALFDFDTGRLRIAAESAGSTYSFERDGHAVSIEIPPFSWPEMVPAELVEEGWNEEGRFGVFFPDYRSALDAGAWVDIETVRIGIETEGAVEFPCVGTEYLSHPWGPDPLHTRDASDADALLQQLQPLAAAIAEHFVGWVRAGFRQRVGIGRGSPRILNAAVKRSRDQRAIVADHEFRSALEQRNPFVMSADDLGLALTPSAMRVLFGRVERNEPLPAAETLLRDAEYLLWGLASPNAQVAVLLAGVACEVKAKSVLRDRASESAAPILNLMLIGSEVSTTALALLHGVAKAITGRSLNDENKNLFQAAKRLFEIRNRVAHRGQEIPVSEAEALLRSATEVFEWLDAL